jgi:hypothetical protein
VAPQRTAELLLNPSIAEPELYRSALTLWSIAWILSSILFIPFLEFFHLEWKSLAFVFPVFLASCFTLLLQSVAIHFGLRLLGAPSRFPETLVLYTVRMIPATVLLTFLQYPTLWESLVLLRSLKHARAITWKEVWRIMQATVGPGNVPSILEGAVTITGYASSVFLVLMLYSLAGAIERHYDAPRTRVYLAVSVGWYATAIPKTVLDAVYALSMYVALNTGR